MERTGFIAQYIVSRVDFISTAIVDGEAGRHQRGEYYEDISDYEPSHQKQGHRVSQEYGDPGDDHRQGAAVAASGSVDKSSGPIAGQRGEYEAAETSLKNDIGDRNTE